MMQAANPGCLLEDFVRWYSPRDWIEGEPEEDSINHDITTTSRGDCKETPSSAINVTDKRDSVCEDDVGDSEREGDTVAMDVEEAVAKDSGKAGDGGESGEGGDGGEAGGRSDGGEAGDSGAAGDSGEAGGDGWDNEGWGEDDWDVLSDDIALGKEENSSHKEQIDKKEVPTVKVRLVQQQNIHRVRSCSSPKTNNPVQAQL